MKKNKKMEKKYIRITPKMVVFAVLSLWILSIGGTWFLTKKIQPEDRDKEYSSLLNPRLKTFDLDTPEERNAKLFATLVPLKEKVMGNLGGNKEKVAFYVEDLNTGSWIGWKERDPFIAASLLKVPIAVGVMKKIEGGQWSLDTTFSVEAKYKDGNFGELWKVPDGTSVTVEKLMKEMLQNSDNTAANIFFDKLSREERDDVYYHIGVTNPEAPITQKTNNPLFSDLSSKDLASMFRALYNSTYLTRKSSSYILEILTQTKFDELVPTVIPKDIKVAHKMGNYFNSDPERPKNYHDCGIAYYPQHPYLYCILTTGIDATTAKENISSTSGIIYSYFNEKEKE